MSDSRMTKKSRNKTRSKFGGSAISEFAVGTMILVLFLLLPMFNVAMLPVRFMISNGIISELALRLAHCESRSQSYKLMTQNNWWKSTLATCGITTSNENLSLLITTSDGQKSIVVNQGQQVPADWLPGGKNAPCIYSLETKMSCSAAPFFRTSALSVDGLTKPVTISLAGHSSWGNLSRNPKTLAYFINE